MAINPRAMWARPRFGARALGAAALALISIVLGSVAATAAVGRLAVEFEVVNRNGSALSCASDGATYSLRGEIVGPAEALAAPPVNFGATLYLHEFSFGAFFWNFDAAPGYDWARALAEVGHTSVVIDRLGYDASDHPLGSAVCFGSHADIVAQVVRQLRDGSYASSDTAAPPAFGRVALGGHSVGGGIAELAAHSFADLEIAGLMLFAWADQGYSPRAVQQSLAQGSDCASGGAPAEPGEPSGYAYYGRTEADFQANVFFDAAPYVVAAATAMRNRDPCGDNATLTRLAAVNAEGVGSLELPVLLVFGNDDAIFLPTAADAQAALFTSSPSVTLERVDAGHALALERAAPDVHAIVDQWLVEELPEPNAALSLSAALALLGLLARCRAADRSSRRI